MGNVFKAGDIVYHPTEGRGYVKNVDNGKLPVCILFDSRAEVVWCGEKNLSFTPWPAPNHERPLKDGLYWKSCVGVADNVVRRQNGVFYYFLDGVLASPISKEVVEISKFIYIGE